jgi:hypothetical protein
MMGVFSLLRDGVKTQDLTDGTNVISLYDN